MKTNLENKIIELWHVSKGQYFSRYDRMIYVKSALLVHYPELVKGYSNKEIWFAIEDQLN